MSMPELTDSVVPMDPLTQGLDSVSMFVAVLIGYVGVAIITYGALKGFFGFLSAAVFGHNRLPLIRLDLGKHLALGLEFLVGKDVVESIVHPTWEDLGKLGVIIALRTVVTIFLARELKEVEEELKVEMDEVVLEERQRKLHKV